MTTRAKMKVQTVTQTEHSDVVELSCVMGGRKEANEKEDNSFARYTPSGSMKLQIDNPALRGVIRPGQHYYVDLTPLPADGTP